MPDRTQPAPASDSSLQKVVVLLAAILTKDEESLADKVKILRPLGLTNPEIAQAAGATGDAVRKAVSRLK